MSRLNSRVIRMLMISALLLSPFHAFAQGKVIRVRFPKGRTSIILKGIISDRAPIDYLVGAKQGQTMTLHLTSSNKLVDFRIFAADGQRLFDSAYDRVVQIPSTGDYRIRLIKTQLEARHTTSKYTLEINIR